MSSQYSSNYAVKFSPKVQESFKKHAYTNAAVNHNFDFIGVQSVKLYSVDTARMQNYAMTGSIFGSSNSRYGTVEELATSIQEMKMQMDRSFTFAIDKRENMDTLDVLNPGKALQRQIEQVVVPEVDKYRIAKIMNELWGLHSDMNHQIKRQTTKVDNTNAYDRFLDAKVAMLNKGIPMAGTFAYITPAFYKAIRTDNNFIKASDIAQDMLIKGQVGMIDGIPLVLIPDSYFPKHGAVSGDIFTHLSHMSTVFNGSNIHSGDIPSFMLINSEAVVAAEKLADYKVHDNPPGINGYLIEGRLYYDCFVLKKKEDMIHIEYAPSV